MRDRLSLNLIRASQTKSVKNSEIQIARFIYTCWVRGQQKLANTPEGRERYL